jgi:hypothetical protein
MKTIISFALIAMLLSATTAFAATTVDTTWSGGGSFGTTFTSGDDAHSSFSTNGALISGQFHATDYDDNPYTYSVDTTNTNVMSHVGNGWMEYRFTRDGSYSPMYGVAGQQSYTYIGSSGTGDFAWTTTSNYAALGNSEYGFQNNNQMQATGSHYDILHSISANINNGAGIAVHADGTTQISDMCDSASGATSYTFGKGCGCYTNAVANTVGSGSFNLFADADHQIVTDTGITVNGGSLTTYSDFTGGFHFNNFALTGN